MKVLLLTLLLLGCGNETVAHLDGTYNHHPQRQGDLQGDTQLISELYTELDKNLATLGYGEERFLFSINYGPLDAKTLGICYTDKYTDHRSIVISDKLRDSPDHRAAVLLHELGHCLWNQAHYDPQPATPDVMNAIADWGVAEYLDYYRGVFQERVAR